MGYAQKNLIPGETLLYETRLHWIVLLRHLLLALVLVTGAVASLIVKFDNPEVRHNAQIAGGIMLALAAAIIIAGLIQRNATEMGVTNRRVLIKQGMMKRRTLEMLLSKIESIGVEEPVLGRILGYGTVVIRGTGGTPEQFEKIAHPSEFRNQVNSQIEAHGTR